MKLANKLFTLLFIATFIISCDENENDDKKPKTSSINLETVGLTDLGESFAYEGWLIVDGSPVSTGIFSIDADGNLSSGTFEVDADDASNATTFVVSIEPVPDNDPAPAATKILIGDISNGTAALNTSLIGDFSSIGGSFFLRTPTDETDGNNGNDEYGVWFGTPGAPPVTNFTLPNLPGGWAYEGWVVGETGPLTTGVFTSFDMKDQGAPYSGAQGGPPIPGEDFLNNAPIGESFPLDIRGRTVVISIEPVPDNSPMPFLLKPLIGVAGQETAPATYSFDSNTGSLPGGSISIE